MFMFIISLLYMTKISFFKYRFHWFLKLESPNRWNHKAERELYPNKKSKRQRNGDSGIDNTFVSMLI